MNRIKQVLFVVPALVLTLSLAAVSGYAEDGGNATASGQSETGSSVSTTSGSSNLSSNKASGSDSETNDSANETEVEAGIHQRGAELLNEAEKNHKNGKSSAQTQKVCENRKHGIQTKTGTLVANAQASLNRINKVLTQIENYQKANNLTVANWDSLIASSTAAQSQATASVQALAAVNPTLDCTSTSAAAELATFKAAVAQARTNLLAYRSAVKDVLVAVENAKSSGGQQ